MTGIRKKFLREGVTIRTYLLALVLAAVIPLGAFVAALLYLISSTQEAEMESAMLESAEALAAAIESNIDSGLKRMVVLANESSLHVGNIDQFAQRCREAVSGSPDWRSLLLSASDGTQLVNTLRPLSTSLPSGLGLPWVKQAFDTGKPVVSRLFIGRISKQPIVGLAVPVTLQGSVQYVLASGLDLGFLRDLITRGVGVEGGVAVLLDQELTYIARSNASESLADGFAPSRLRQQISARVKGVGNFRTEEGLEVVGSWVRMPQSGWTVLVANPLAAHRSTWLRYIALLGAICLFVAGAGAVAARLLAQRIAQDVHKLGAEADTLASGTPVAGTGSSIVELQALGQAHQRAGTRLRELLEREREHRELAEAQNKSKDEFLAMLGHELRNPLGAISNAGALLQMQNGDPKAVQFASEMISRQSGQLRRLIDDLLDVNRIVSGKISLEVKPVNLLEAVQNAVSALQARDKEHAITVEAKPVWVEADPARLEQVLSNLLSNATAHTPAEGRIRVEVEQQGDSAILRVADTGIGIEPEHLGRIFDLFYQVPQALDRAKGGLGIGLTLVQRLVQLHGGSVSVSSEGHNRGATFTVSLPAVPAPAPTPTPREAVPRYGAIEQVRILLVEDDPDSRESLKRVLELNGHSIEVAPDGVAGLAKAAQWHPDIAIVDIGLPQMNGYEVAKAIRRELGGKPTLVALTGYGLPEDEQRSRAAGFDQHLVKPVDFDRLLEIVARLS
ncbi:MAG: hybrid sensor histidine kinase/response regulator [Burkholderiales bacterium]